MEILHPLYKTQNITLCYSGLLFPTIFASNKSVSLSGQYAVDLEAFDPRQRRGAGWGWGMDCDVREAGSNELEKISRQGGRVEKGGGVEQAGLWRSWERI